MNHPAFGKLMKNFSNFYGLSWVSRCRYLLWARWEGWGTSCIWQAM